MHKHGIKTEEEIMVVFDQVCTYAAHGMNYDTHNHKQNLHNIMSICCVKEDLHL